MSDHPSHGPDGVEASIGDGAEPTSAARRRALAWFGAICGSLAALVAGVPVLGYLFSPIFHRRPDGWVDLGPTGDFAIGNTKLVYFTNPVRQPWDGQAARLAAYVRRAEEEAFQVFSVNCTHLGCPVSWFPQSGLFLCPCHGGVYYENGEHASGPPPRGLYQYRSKIEKGRLLALVGHLPTLQDPA